MTTAAMTKADLAAHGLKLHRGATFGEVSNAVHRLNNRQNQPMRQSGTPSAITYLRIGGPADSACTKQKRGGARNRADRISHELTPLQIGKIIAATAHADAIGLPFTRMVTIHWEAAGVPLAGMARATGRYTDLMGKALARHGSGAAWLWTHENGDGKGGHCHLLAHVPAELALILTGLQRGWLRRITGKPYRARVIRSKAIGRRLGLEAGNPDLHAINLEPAVSYVLKGASSEAASQFGLVRLEAGGRVIGKRCGVSQNIGPKARTTAGAIT